MKLPCLEPGDIIDVVAPSSKCHPSVIEKFKAVLTSWGLQCRIPDDLFGDNLLYANSDEKRFSHLQEALLNPTSKVVWCLLGGYGSTRLMPMLSQLKPPTHPKILIGFSDITALHIFLQGQWGWSTLSGSSGYQISLNKVTQDSIDLLKDFLFRGPKTLSYHYISPLNKLAETAQTITAPIIGGNLHVMQASLGTFWQINAADKILFIEEINERAYRVDRVLAQLEQAGIVGQARAILFGDMPDKGEPDGRFIIKELLHEFSVRCSVPVLQINNIGHTPVNHPLLLGYPAKLSMGNNYSLHFVC